MPKKPTKYIFVTGGVLSGLGKGITAASIGNLLKARGLKVNIQKCDPYLNIDAGTLNPREHGECFVTKDGAETDLDLGHYERFLDEELTQPSSLMSGRVLLDVIQDERDGKSGGNSIQIIPHVTSKIQDYIELAGKGYDVHIVEIGGTVGDYESLSFIEAIREFSYRVGRQNCVYIHVVYLPYLGASQEIKTKPAQNSVRDLRSLGIIPDILVARSENPAKDSIRKKLSLFCGIGEDSIALVPNESTIYKVPITLEKTGLVGVIANKLKLKTKKPNMKKWQDVVEKANAKYDKTINVGLVAKYMDNADTYMSVFEAIRVAAWSNGCEANIQWIDAEEMTNQRKREKALKEVDGILVPGGFGIRGVEGKISAAQYALTNNLPYLGLCLGLQVAIIAAARNSGIEDANSQEINPDSKHLVVSTMSDQVGKENTGGSMRLGDYVCELESKSLARKLYGSKSIVERHRHRYECNNEYIPEYEKWGIRAVGLSPQGDLVEMIEAPANDFFLASQFHPEFKSRPTRVHPMFDGFIRSMLQ
ncbi:MAG: CTP synthase [Candidatus Saccharibacteria bacterium]